MLESEWTLFVCMTLYTSCVRARCESCLFELETAVRVMTIAALHRAFEHLVMKRQIELVLCFAVTTETKLGFAAFQ